MTIGTIARQGLLMLAARKSDPDIKDTRPILNSEWVRGLTALGLWLSVPAIVTGIAVAARTGADPTALVAIPCIAGSLLFVTHGISRTRPGYAAPGERHPLSVRATTRAAEVCRQGRGIIKAHDNQRLLDANGLTGNDDETAEDRLDHRLSQYLDRLEHDSLPMEVQGITFHVQVYDDGSMTRYPETTHGIQKLRNLESLYCRDQLAYLAKQWRAASGRTDREAATYNQNEQPMPMTTGLDTTEVCEVCLGDPAGSCSCTECEACGSAGDPGCYMLLAADAYGHGMAMSQTQLEHRQERLAIAHEHGISVFVPNRPTRNAE